MVEPCRQLTALGFKLLATGGTAKTLMDAGVTVEKVNKVHEGRPHIVDAITNGEVQLVFNTTEGRQSLFDSYSIRRTALEMKVPCYTTASAARASIKSIAAIDAGKLEPRSLQSYSRGSARG
jgi:carbamoyl-phosphate synthase large subunit